MTWERREPPLNTLPFSERSRLFAVLLRLLSVAVTADGWQAYPVARQDISNTFGAVVKKHRLAKGLSQESLAEKADVHHTYISLLERGQRVPGIDVAERIARAFGMKLSQLVAEGEKAGK
jgi:ribosome-binding protein aMBF1 (putative translation factor)